MSLSTLNGFSVLSCRLHVPAWGPWYAEAEIDRPEALAGAVTLVLADTTWRGTVLSGGPWAGRARYRLVGGAGGWGRTIPSVSYANDLGVKLAGVFGDAARACGETLGALPAGATGPAYVRPVGPASSALEQLAAEQWYVDAAGVTQLGRRPARTYTGPATRLRTDLAGGSIELAALELAPLVPGAVVDGIEALDVEHTLSDAKLRTRLWGRGGGAYAQSLPASLRAIVDALTRRHRFAAPYEYRVVERVGERYSLQPVRVSLGMPTLRGVRVRPGVAGAIGDAALGSLVLVAFVNGEPSRPVVTAFDDPESPGFETTKIRFGEAGAADPLVRKSDLQSAVGSIQSTFNAHQHASLGAPPTAISPAPGGAGIMNVTATGSAVVKAGA